MSFKNKSLLFFIGLEVFFVLLTILFVPLVNKLSVTNAYIYGPKSKDRAAFPKPVVPCTDIGMDGIRDPEFHSLRPYEASPCSDGPKAWFCNNDYRIIEDVSQEWDSALCDEITFICQMTPNTGIACPNSPTGVCPTYIVGGPEGRDYEITLSKVQLPIMGNTNDMLNSQSAIDTYDAVGKMNEYVNWYLQGVTDKAEYGWKRPDIDEAFGGPTKKLLPYDILNHQRLWVLHDGSVEPKPPPTVNPNEYQGPMEYIEIDPDTGEWHLLMNEAHNQIAVCTKGSEDIPVPCYTGDGTQTNGGPRRLATNWWVARGSTPNQVFYDWTILDSWGGQTPPFPWQFSNGYLYQKAFLEWKGQVCLPFANLITYMCFGGIKHNGPLRIYYNFIPLGNANDINAGHYVGGPQVRASGNTKYKLMQYFITHSPVLHYPHMEASVQVSNLLNNINTPLECEEDESGNVDEGTPLPGEGDPCCPAGYSYNNQAGACLNDAVSTACGGVSTAICTVVNLAPGEDTCNSNVVTSACKSAMASVEANGDSQAICTSIVGIAGLTKFGQAVIDACSTAVNVILTTINNINEPIACSDKLICRNAVCSQPENPLNCHRISGAGTAYEPESCEFVQIATNKGDPITFRNPASYLAIEDVKIRVDQIECQNKEQISKFLAPYADGGCNGIARDECQTLKCFDDPLKCGGYCSGTLFPAFCTDTPDCKAELQVTIPTTPKIPYITQIWKSAVINKTSSFRRIFPKIEKDAPVECIAEIPGYSGVVYTTNNETNLRLIFTAGPSTYTGNGPDSDSPATLFFPHLGTVYEYFLKGIQTALRPKVLSQQRLPQGDPLKCYTLESGECKMWLFESDANDEYYYNKIIEAASRTYCDGKSLNPYWAIFIALNEDAGLLSDHIEGWGDRHFGCKISESLGPEDAIDVKTACMLDTLRSDCSKGMDDFQSLCKYGYTSACDNSYADFENMSLLTNQGTPPPLWGENNDTEGEGNLVGNLIQNLLSIDWYRALLSGSKGPLIISLNCPNSPSIEGPIPPSGK